MHRAALPWRAAEDTSDRGIKAGVGVGDDELDADQAAGDEAAQELRPKGFGLGFADVKSDELAPAGLVNAMRDDHALAADAAAVAHFLDFGVDKQEAAGLRALGPSEFPRLDRLV